jgi:hypothetical protein
LSRAEQEYEAEEGLTLKTTQQLVVGTVVYSVALATVVFFTRPTGRRFAGALAGAAVIAGMGLWVLIPLGEERGWWCVPLDPSPSYMTLLYLGTTVSTVPIFLVTWRISRRFGWRRLGVTLAVAEVGGPPREFAVGAKFPEWVTYAPGIATILALSAGYVGGRGGARGDRLVAGPAKGSRLARWPWEAAQSGAAPDQGRL